MKVKIIVISVQLALISTAFAETAQLDEVVITATRGGSSALAAPAPIAKVDKQTLLDVKAHQIDEVANRVLGVPIRPAGVFNHNALNEINLPGQDALEVLRGSAGALYGGNSIGGTFNF